MYIFDFTVIGTGEFPADMLRYDACYPTDSESAGNITICRSDIGATEIRKVTLRVRSATKDGCRITPERWRSFGWAIERSDGRVKKV